MDIKITDEQYFSLLGEVFDARFPKIKYRNEKFNLYVYDGDKGSKILKKYEYNHILGVTITPNVLMNYYRDENYLVLSYLLQESLSKIAPGLYKSELFAEFFKEWFEKKFKIRPLAVYI